MVVGSGSIIWLPITRRSIPRGRPSVRPSVRRRRRRPFRPDIMPHRPGVRRSRSVGRGDDGRRCRGRRAGGGRAGRKAGDCFTAPIHRDLCVLCHFYRTRRRLRRLMVGRESIGVRRTGGNSCVRPTGRVVSASVGRRVEAGWDSYRRCCLMQPRRRQQRRPSIDEPPT